ncbi:hypothetical protein [Litoribacter populi]|uniref:hypothetical protein n=1 Tax=Litoribacter populi TaxID=2598460 RepID=UPI001180EB84|nr:hypothetical protein [Litoribacter populi]
MIKSNFSQKIFFLFACPILFLSSCIGDLCGCVDMAGFHYDMSVVDEQGRNLISEETPNHIIPSDIRIFIVENGEEVMVRQEGGVEIESRHGVVTVEVGDEKRLRLFYDSEGRTEDFTSIIQWSEGDRDILDHRFNSEKKLIQVVRNEEVLWDAEGNAGAVMFTMVKK